jgi:peptidyl-prolyl cis-trans isomerase B (cyclophilin B)
MNSFIRRLAISLLITAFITQNLCAQDNPRVLIHTSMGDFQLELFADKAAASVDNFLGYAKSGAYEGTIFHRVISSFMIQGGGFTPEMEKRPTREPIVNEANNGLSNTRGTVAMARTNDPHSATSQFFINTQDNLNLNHTSEASPRTWGYAVFGRVVEGMEVVDDIRFVETTTKPPYSNVPKVPVVIERVEILSD